MADDRGEILTPSWPVAVKIFCACLRNGGNEKAKDGAEKELQRLAQAYEEAIALLKRYETGQANGQD